MLQANNGKHWIALTYRLGNGTADVKLFKKLIVFGETYHTLVETKPKCVVS
jgi:hypothetical protein